MPDKRWWLGQLLQSWKLPISTIFIFLRADSFAIAEVSSYGLSWPTRGVYTQCKAKNRCKHHGWSGSRQHSQTWRMQDIWWLNCKGVCSPHGKGTQSGSKSRHCVGLTTVQKHRPEKSVLQDQLNEDVWNCPVPYQRTGNSFFAWMTTRQSCLNSLTVNL